MELRYWLMIICALAIVVILVDAVRRKKKKSYYQGKYTSDMDELSDFPLAELPSGGAKVRAMTPEEILERDEKLMLKHKVPLLLDSVDTDTEMDQPENKDDEEFEAHPQHYFDFNTETTGIDSSEDLESEANNDESSEHYDVSDDDYNDAESEERLVSEKSESFSAYFEDEIQNSQQDQESLGTDSDASTPELSGMQDTDDNYMSDEDKDKHEKPIDLFASTPPGQDLIEPEDVIVINVVSDIPAGFNNENLMEIVLACGMRYGAMDIFHRTDEVGRLQFSMANCTKPGTFDIDNFSLSPIKGISLFMTLPCSSDAMQSFDYMYETANVLSRHLNGILKDQVHSVMREQSIEHCRDRIREFAREQLLNQ